MSSKRVKKKLNEMIQSENNVPDYVLDAARIEMKRNIQTSRLNNTKKLYFKFAIPLLTTLILIVACIPLMIPSVQEEKPPLYGDSTTKAYYSTLTKTESLSILDYNKTYHEELFYIHSAELLEANYLIFEDDILALEEQMVFEGVSILFLVSAKTLDISFEEFPMTDQMTYTDSVNIYYAIRNKCYAEFEFGDFQYYFFCETTDQEKFLKICQNISKN